MSVVGEERKSLPTFKMTAFVKVFGCRPMTVVRHTPGAGVRKPPGEETAVGGVDRRRGRYGELSAIEDQGQRRP
jgi:hypothetical protein